MVESPFPNDVKGMIPDPTLVENFMYRVAFTCDCQEFEFVIQTRQGSYRIWVDGSWLTDSEIAQQNDYPRRGFYRVQFPDKRPRQIRIGLTGVPPFFGLVTHPSDAISPPQVPLGPRVIIFGDSWTGPTIVQPALPPPQPGGTGYAQILGEYFNWDWWEDGRGGTGFANPGGPNGITFVQRAQTDICGRNPDTVLVMGGINDAGFGEPAIEQAVTQFLSDVEACVPNAKIYFSGPQITITDVSAGIHAAVAKFSNVYYGDPGAESWFYGSPTDPSTGNAYLYLNSHPTPLGHDYWAEKEAQFILNGFPALAPQTFPLFDSAPAAGTFNYSVAQQTILPAGPHEISVTFTPQDNVNYATVTQKATLTVEKATTSVSLSSSASSIAPGSTLTFASTVTPQIAGVPTGTVTFLDIGNAIGTGTLNQSGTASFSTSSLAIGTHSITASYSGDENFFGSMSSQSVPVVVVKPDFSFSISSTQLTVAPTQSGTVTVTVTPISGLVANLNLSCSGLPSNATCSLANEAQIVVNDRTTVATVTQDNCERGAIKTTRHRVLWTSWYFLRAQEKEQAGAFWMGSIGAPALCRPWHDERLWIKLKDHHRHPRHIQRPADSFRCSRRYDNAFSIHHGRNSLKLAHRNRSLRHARRIIRPKYSLSQAPKTLFDPYLNRRLRREDSASKRVRVGPQTPDFQRGCAPLYTMS